MAFMTLRDQQNDGRTGEYDGQTQSGIIQILPDLQGFTAVEVGAIVLPAGLPAAGVAPGESGSLLRVRMEYIPNSVGVLGSPVILIKDLPLFNGSPLFISDNHSQLHCDNPSSHCPQVPGWK